MNRRLAVLALVCLCVAMSGCGFHLRGSTALTGNMSLVHVLGVSPTDRLGSILFRQLGASGAVVVPEDEADAIIDVTSNEEGRRVLSVNSQGKVREYQLFLVLRYAVKFKGRDVAEDAEPERIDLTRDYIFDENDVLGKGQEEALLFEELRQDAVRLMIYRLQAVS